MAASFSPGATGDLCKDTVNCLHLRITHILAYMYLRYARPLNLRLPRGSAAGATSRCNGSKVSFCSCIPLRVSEVGDLRRAPPCRSDLWSVSVAGHESRLRGTRKRTKGKGISWTTVRQPPSGMHRKIALAENARHNRPMDFVSFRAPRRRRSWPAGMSSPTGRSGCAATDETKSQVRARCRRRGSPQAIRHARPAFVVARSAKHASIGHPETFDSA